MNDRCGACGSDNLFSGFFDVDDKEVPTFQIDMNAVHGDTVETLLTHALEPISAQLSPPKKGDWVLIVDEEANRCVAKVEETSGLWLLLSINWDYWMPSLDFERTSPIGPFLRPQEGDSQESFGGQLLAVPDDRLPGSRWTTFCQDCGAEWKGPRGHR